MTSDELQNNDQHEGAAQPPASEMSERASRLSAQDDQDAEAVVAKYERRYHGDPNAVAMSDFSFDDEPKRKRKNDEPAWEQPRRRMPRWAAQPAPRAYSSAYLNEDERLWSSIAHASVWITVLGGLFTSGVVVPFSIFIPLIIFLYWRKRSDYVAFQALQAFAVQVLVTAGVALFAFVGGIVWVVGLLIALLLMIVLVGFILVPVWALVGLAVTVLLAVAPFAALALGTVGAVRTYQGRDFQYPGVGRWLDRRLAQSIYQTV
jgi:uncharacterized Tic20 family protein